MKTTKTIRKRGLTAAGKRWVKAVEDRKENRIWLKHSGNIARRVLSAIEDIEGMNQRKLADIMGVTPQQISKIVKGQENFTLETIAKLSQALNVELINFPDYKYSKKVKGSKRSVEVS